MNYTRPTLTFFFALAATLFLVSCGGTSACDCKNNDKMGNASDTELEEKCKEAQNNMSSEEKADYISSYNDCK